MHLAGKPLKAATDLQKAIDQQIPVAVYQHGEMIDKGGLIEQQTAVAVKINGNYFLKATCEFKTR